MTKFYADSEEKYLNGVLLYAVNKEPPFQPTDEELESVSVLCYDEAGTMPVSISEAKNLFLKNVMLVAVDDLGGMNINRPITMGPVQVFNGYNILGITLGDGTDPVRCFEEADSAINPPSNTLPSSPGDMIDPSQNN